MNKLQIIDEVNDVVNNSLLQGDPYYAIEYGSNLKRGIQLRGVALAKLLWLMFNRWSEFEELGIGDDFYSVIESEWGLTTQTISKYIRMWDSVFESDEIPDAIKQRLLTKPVSHLLLLPALAEDDVIDVEWREIANTTDRNSLRRLIKEYRGERTSSKNSVYIKLDMRTGQLYAKRGDNMYTPFGVINLDVADEACKSAIARIVREARIMEA